MVPQSGVLEADLWLHSQPSLRLWKLCRCLLLTFLFVLQTPNFFNSSLWRSLFCLLMIRAAFLLTFSDSIISLPRFESESDVCHRMSWSHAKVPWDRMIWDIIWGQRGLSDKAVTTKYHSLPKSSMKSESEGPSATQVGTGQNYLKDIQGDWKVCSQRDCVTVCADSGGSQAG